MHRFVAPILLAILIGLTTVPAGAGAIGERAGVFGKTNARKTPTPAAAATASPGAASPAAAPAATLAPATPAAAPAATAPAGPTVAATASPATPTAALKPGGQLLVAPLAVAPGRALEVAAKDFGARETLSIWLTDPAGSAMAAAEQSTTRDGAAYFALTLPGAAPAGRWAITAQGQASRRQAVATFSVTGAAPAATATPAQPPAAASAVAPGSGSAPDAAGSGEPAPAVAAATATVTPAKTPPPATAVNNSDIAAVLPPAAPNRPLSPRLARTYFGAAARLTGVPIEVLLAVAAVESGFRPNAVGPYLPQFAGTIDEHALGMMQFLPSTYRPYAPVVDRITGKKLGMRGLWDPESAVYAAALYLRDSGAPRDLRRALYRYNNAEWYVRLVLAWADYYANGGEIGGAPLLDPARLAQLPDPAARSLAATAPVARPDTQAQASHAAGPPVGLAELLGLMPDRLDWPRLQRLPRSLPV
jgi:hypothetical protein